MGVIQCIRCDNTNGLITYVPSTGTGNSAVDLILLSVWGGSLMHTNSTAYVMTQGIPSDQLNFLFTFPLGEVVSQFGITYCSYAADAGFIAHMIFSSHKSNTFRELFLSKII